MMGTEWDLSLSIMMLYLCNAFRVTTITAVYSKVMHLFCRLTSMQITPKPYILVTPHVSDVMGVIIVYRIFTIGFRNGENSMYSYENISKKKTFLKISERTVVSDMQEMKIFLMH